MDTLYSHAGPGTVYAVPVVKRTESQQQFGDEHESHCKERQNHGGGGVDENGRKKHKKHKKHDASKKFKHKHKCHKCGAIFHSAKPQGVRVLHGTCRGCCSCQPPKVFKTKANTLAVHCLPCKQWRNSTSTWCACAAWILARSRVVKLGTVHSTQGKCQW